MSFIQPTYKSDPPRSRCQDEMEWADWTRGRVLVWKEIDRQPE